MDSYITFVLPLLPPLNSRNGMLRMHWSKRKKLQKQFTELCWAERCQRPSKDWPLERARVHVIRRACGVEPDHDNLAASCKLLLDAMVKGGMLADDSPKHIELEIRWERAPTRNEQQTEVSVYAIAPVEKG